MNEIIKSDYSFISGDEPEVDLSKISSKKTTDELEPMTITDPPAWASFGVGYRMRNENVIKKDDFNYNDVLNREELIELPNIYNINNPNLVNALKRVISILNNENNEIDKVAVFSDLIKNLNFKDIKHNYKKALISILKKSI